jgi:hypothetical protein
MKTHIDHQILTKNGKPEFAVLPYSDFLKLARLAEKQEADIEETAIPMQVVELHVIEGKSMPSLNSRGIYSVPSKFTPKAVSNSL